MVYVELIDIVKRHVLLHPDQIISMYLVLLKATVWRKSDTVLVDVVLRPPSFRRFGNNEQSFERLNHLVIEIVNGLRHATRVLYFAPRQNAPEFELSHQMEIEYKRPGSSVFVRDCV